ncbi:hypothetical protein GCM10028796_26760 [Ramlibacter monticola]|uniref:Uncharacterized protein n=1 Tax=Ramlibacter monticola TaxID=1926872 RepID=A0A936Z4W1_9BURK|nr:hypothetical protein [Ramlibacter monticola]MBL0393730.1 hypothetical protein [Ramlibacter monticola]
MSLGKFAIAMVLLVVLGVAAWPSATQTSEVGGVTVAVTPGNLDPDSSLWDFAIAFEAGSRRLDDEVLDSIVLVGDGRRMKPLAWEGEAGGVRGHRAGVLKFIAIRPRPQELRLEMTRPGEAKPRVFRFVFGEWSA